MLAVLSGVLTLRVLKLVGASVRTSRVPPLKRRALALVTAQGETVGDAQGAAVETDVRGEIVGVVAQHQRAGDTPRLLLMRPVPVALPVISPVVMIWLPEPPMNNAPPVAWGQRAAERGVAHTVNSGLGVHSADDVPLRVLSPTLISAAPAALLLARPATLRLRLKVNGVSRHRGRGFLP